MILGQPLATELTELSFALQLCALLHSNIGLPVWCDAGDQKLWQTLCFSVAKMVKNRFAKCCYHGNGLPADTPKYILKCSP